jgi:superfamily II DNA or RNA helicase
MEQTTITREEGVRLAVDCYLKHDRLLALYPPGFGKSKLALDAVAQRLTGRLFYKGLIVCHSVNARDTDWPDQIQQWQPGLRANTALVCYGSLHHLVGNMYDYVICDEAHYLTLANSRFFQFNRVDSLILLTGTEHHDAVKRGLARDLSKGHVVQIPLDQAVDSGILPQFRINAWFVDLDRVEEAEYLRLCQNVDKITRFKPELNKKAIGARSRFLYDLPTKQKAARYLMQKMERTGKKRLIFCQTKEMCDALSPYRYHSGTDERHYELFKEGLIKELTTIKQVREGANIPDLPTGLIVSLNSTPLALLQQLGRLFRVEVGGEPVKLHILVARNTMDEHWFYSATKGIAKERINKIDLKRELYDQ